MRIVSVDEKYVLKLREIDERVYYNKGGKRPYIGFLVDVDGVLYVAPLTSPKVNIKIGRILEKTFTLLMMVIRAYYKLVI